jgi:hypothetical protein
MNLLTDTIESQRNESGDRYADDNNIEEFKRILTNEINM